MWLADAVAAYVERLTEREFDAPFIALLRQLGYTDVHLTHGPYEFGKDFIARRNEGGHEHQWCFQTKAGDINSKQLRTDVQPQINLMRAGTVVHPAFNKDLPRHIVVVTTGRLVGGAGIEFQQVEHYHRDRGEVGAELWDIDTLVPDLVTTLITSNDLATQGRLLEMVGRLQGMHGSRADIAALGSRWLAPGDGDKHNWRDVLTACLLANTAAQNAREDLAQQAIWLLVRAYYRATERGEKPDSALLDVAHLASDTVATDFWEQIRTAADPLKVTLQATGAAASFLTHPIKVARLCETLAMLALTRINAGHHDAAAELLDFVESLIQSTPALSHLVGEEWTFSVLVTVVALAASGRVETAILVVRRTMVWLLDLAEDGVLLPPMGASPAAVVDRMLATAYKAPAAVRTKDGYTFAVLADLAALLADVSAADPASSRPTGGAADDGGGSRAVDAGDVTDAAAALTQNTSDPEETGDLFDDFVHDLHALRAMASLTLPTGIESSKHIARVEYVTTVPRANHHKAEAAAAWPVDSWLDSLEIWGTFRDRHLPGVLATAIAAGTAESVTAEP